MSTGPADKVLDPFKDIVWDVVISRILGELISKYLGVLGAGFLGSIVKRIFIGFADKIYEAIREVINMRVIVLKNEAAQKEFDRASVALKQIANSHGIDSEEFKKAREDEIKVLQKLVQFDVARNSGRV